MFSIPVNDGWNARSHIAARAAGSRAELFLVQDGKEYALEASEKKGDWFMFRFPFSGDMVKNYLLFNFANTYIDLYARSQLTYLDQEAAIFFRLRTYDAAGNLLHEEDIEP